MQSIEDEGAGLPEKSLSDELSGENDHVVAATTSGWKKKTARVARASFGTPCMSATVMARGIGVSIEQAIEWRNVLHTCK